MHPPPAYWDYLRLEELLSLQNGFEKDEGELLPDELHFIIVHQTFELWFKLVLRSLRLARDHLAAPRVAEETIPHVSHHLRRASMILRLGVQQFEVMESLTPQDFLAFRDKLVPSSGFQSWQMREMEVLLGLHDSARIRYGGQDPLEHIRGLARGSASGMRAWDKIEKARQEDSLLRVLEDWLYRAPIQGSTPDDAGDSAVVNEFIDDYLAASATYQAENLRGLLATLGKESPGDLGERFTAMQKAAEGFLRAEDIVAEQREKMRRVRAAALFIESYRNLPLLSWPRLLLDVVVETEEQLLLWRHRHVRMVERVIGRRVGTGGSSGVDYLDKTLSYRVFQDLWVIRTVLLPRDMLPALKNPRFYGFA